MEQIETVRGWAADGDGVGVGLGVGVQSLTLHFTTLTSDAGFTPLQDDAQNAIHMSLIYEPRCQFTYF